MMESIENILLAFADDNVERKTLWNSIVPGLVTHYELLARWNPVHNLTREISPERAALVHYRDSFLGLWEMRSLFVEEQNVFDVGSGGGLPGIVLALMNPSLKLTFIEKVAKKASFLRVCARPFENVFVSNASIFDCDKADLLISRATFPWDSLAPLHKHGSICVGFVSDRPAKEEWDIYVKKHSLSGFLHGYKMHGLKRQLVVFSADKDLNGITF